MKKAAESGKKNPIVIVSYAVIMAVGLGTFTGCLAAEGKGDALPESGSHFSEADPVLADSSVVIGNLSFSIHESKQDILEKLEETDWEYSAFDGSEENKYDVCYCIDSWMQLYFLKDECVRLRLIDVVPEGLGETVQTAGGIRPGDTYERMVELYGDSFETHTYIDRGLYTIYRYFIDDCICEFGMPGESLGSVYNADIYIANLEPVYEYGEEVMR